VKWRPLLVLWMAFKMKLTLGCEKIELKVWCQTPGLRARPGLLADFVSDFVPKLSVPSEGIVAQSDADGQAYNKLAGGHAESPKVAAEKVSGERKTGGADDGGYEELLLFMSAQVKSPGVDRLIHDHRNQQEGKG